jgi:Skp family chaperone for outer membrane proteins
MAEELGKVNGGETVNELDTLKMENDLLKNELKTKEAAITGLEKAAKEKDGEMAALKQSLADTGKVQEETKNALGATVTAYKDLVIQVNPGLVDEMIKGTSIEEINESVKSAQALVEKVKQHVAAESARVRVPAGAPQRTPLDLSALSAREKIKYAMEGG